MRSAVNSPSVKWTDKLARDFPEQKQDHRRQSSVTQLHTHSYASIARYAQGVHPCSHHTCTQMRATHTNVGEGIQIKQGRGSACSSIRLAERDRMM